MRGFSTSFSLLTIVLIALNTPSASAQTEPLEQGAPSTPSAPGTSSAPSAPSTFDLHLDAEVGAYGGREGVGVMVGALLLARGSVFEVGAEAQAGDGLGSYDYASFGGVAGLGFAPAAHWRLDLLGELGVESYDHFGHGGLFSSDPGASAIRHYAGSRAAVMYRAGIFEIGYATGFTSDLDDGDVSYTYEGGGLLGDPHEKNANRVRVGTYRVTGMLTLGAAFDL